MSDNIPFEIQVEIIKRFPVKSLIQFRLVSKPWKSLIDSHAFIRDYKGHHTHPQHLLVNYVDSVDFEQKYVSFVDDDTFPQQRFDPTSHMPADLLRDSKVIGTSHGLFCLYSNYQMPSDSCSTSNIKMVVLWNPVVRKSVAIVLPNMSYFPYHTILGFGVCPHTIDPKIIKITHINKFLPSRGNIISWEVEVFTLRSRAWRGPYGDLFKKSISLSSYQVIINGFIYWIAFDSVTMHGGCSPYNLLISFDLKSEEFSEVNLPNTMGDDTTLIYKLRESLVVLEARDESDKLVYCVWMMEDGVPKSFTKLFTLNKLDPSLWLLVGFRKNGDYIFERDEDSKEDSEEDSEDELGPFALVVYKPDSRLINDLQLRGISRSLYVNSYIETLLLLDHPIFAIYDEKDNRHIAK